MNWLITGGSGQLGIAVSRELGYQGQFFSSPNSTELDITLSSIAPKLILERSPNIIVNCAAWTDVEAAEISPEQALRVNSDGAENVARGASLIGAKLIQISTDYVFSGASSKPWQTTDHINPQSAYGITKAEGERRIYAMYPENSYIVRTAWLYSPWGENFAKTMTRLAIRGGGLVRVVSDQMGQPTSATDLAKQLVALGLSGAPAGIYHGTNAGVATWYEFAREIFEIVGGDVKRLIPISSNQYQSRVKRPSNSVLSHDGWARTDLQPMRDWQIALREAMPAIISIVKAEG